MKIRKCCKCGKHWGVSAFDKHKKKYICPKCATKKKTMGKG